MARHINNNSKEFYAYVSHRKAIKAQVDAIMNAKVDLFDDNKMNLILDDFFASVFTIEKLVQYQKLMTRLLFQILAFTFQIL